ncbi:MAG: tripartite tricarboxylate transporter permease, partial [Betaproteobacteria bacterium]
MELSNLLLGFSVALAPTNLLFAFLGVLLGTVIGALPGIGPSAGVAVLLPVTFGMSPVSAMIMLAGIYYGAMYGGTITSVLINTPGESASVMTTLDGFQMALKGRAGAALGMAAIGSFIAGTVSVVLLMVAAPPLADLAVTFGPPEYFALMVLGLTTLASLTGGSMLKGLL